MINKTLYKAQAVALAGLAATSASAVSIPQSSASVFSYFETLSQTQTVSPIVTNLYSSQFFGWASGAYNSTAASINISPSISSFLLPALSAVSIVNGPLYSASRAQLTYYFRINDSVDEQVPLDVFAKLDSLENGLDGLYGSRYFSAGYAQVKISVDDLSPTLSDLQPVLNLQAESCSVGNCNSFSHSIRSVTGISVPSNQIIAVYLEASAVGDITQFLDYKREGSVDAQVYPILFSFNPGFFAAHPGLTLSTSAGIPNSLLPEPTLWGMMIVGFGLVGLAKRKNNMRLATSAG